MAHFSSPTPKRTNIISNSTAIGSFDKGQLFSWQRARRGLQGKTTRRYQGSNGKKRYIGTKNLKATEPGSYVKEHSQPVLSKTHATPQPYHNCWPRRYPLRFGMQIVTLKHKLKAQASGKPKPLTVPDLREQLTDMNCQQGLGDIWEEASMDEVLVYLRGNRNLMLPDWARPLLPSTV